MVRSRLGLPALGCGLALGVGSQAHGEGLNSETLRPNLGNGSALLWESPEVVPESFFSVGLALSHALRPVAIERGGVEVATSEQLTVAHASVAYAPFAWGMVGLNLPLVLYSNPQNKYARNAGFRLRQIDSTNSDGFFPGDANLNVRVRPPVLQLDDFTWAVSASLFLPSGNRQAMVSDDAQRLVLEFPMGLFVKERTWEIFLTPGVSTWDQEDRIYGSGVQDRFVEPILQKSTSLLLAGGARHWLTGGPGSSRAGTLLVEGGVRGDFGDFKVALDELGSPVEWAVGGQWFPLDDLSVHGSLGTGLSSGAGAPLFRLMGGVRWIVSPNGRTPPRQELVEAMPTSGQYTDDDLDRIFAEARVENTAPSLEKNESQLRLRVNDQVFELGSVNFEFGHWKLTPQARATIAELQRRLQALNPEAIKIDGHTDSVGSYEYNLVLSKRRADAVRDELVRLGYDPKIIETEGFSYKYPLQSNATSGGRAANRRIEVLVGEDATKPVTYSPEDEAQFREWIAPGGKKPRGK